MINLGYGATFWAIDFSKVVKHWLHLVICAVHLRYTLCLVLHCSFTLLINASESTVIFNNYTINMHDANGKPVVLDCRIPTGHAITYVGIT